VRRNWQLPLGRTAARGCWLLPRSPGSHLQEIFCCNPSWHVLNCCATSKLIFARSLHWSYREIINNESTCQKSLQDSCTLRPETFTLLPTRWKSPPGYRRIIQQNFSRWLPSYSVALNFAKILILKNAIFFVVPENLNGFMYSQIVFPH